MLNQEIKKAVNLRTEQPDKQAMINIVLLGYRE